MEHADRVQQVRRVTQVHLRGEPAEAVEERQPRRLGQPEAEEARVVQVQRLVLRAPGPGEGRRKRPAPDLGDAPVPVIGHGHRQVLLQRTVGAHVVDAGPGAHGVHVAGGVEHDPILFLRWQQEQGGVEAGEAVHAGEVDEVVVVAVGHLKLQAPGLYPLDREDEHGAARDGVQHPLSPLGEDLPHEPGIGTVEIDALRDGGLLAVVVGEGPVLAGQRRHRGCDGRQAGGGNDESGKGVHAVAPSGWGR